MKTVLVCGGRNFGNYQSLKGSWDKEAIRDRKEEYKLALKTLDSLLINGPPNDEEDQLVAIVCGGARGADQIAKDWSCIYGTPLSVFVANWYKHGKKAGILRNIQMLKEKDIDLVIAFPGGKGTADMVKRSKKAGVKVIEVDYDRG